MIHLQKQKIIVTGAASGIGKAIAIHCIYAGATVIAVDIDGNGLDTLKKEINENTIQTITADVSKSSQIEYVFDIIRKNAGFPDGLINNAGIYFGKSILEYEETEIEQILAVNIKAAVYFSKEFAHYKLKRNEQGCIINISSVSGQEGSSDALYGLSKAALIGLTKSNALNFAPLIRVNCIAPGIIETPMLKKIPPKRLMEYREHELLKEPIKPEDVAETAVFLLSDAAKHYTGAVFDINNGCYIR